MGGCCIYLIAGVYFLGEIAKYGDWLVNEDDFIKGLDHLRMDCDAATQYLYAYLGTYKALEESPEISNALNSSPRYWPTILSGLQSAKFIALGRMFDSNGHYGVIKVIRMASDNVWLFDKESLRKRKMGRLIDSPVWIDEYIRNAYVPNAKDFDRLLRYAKKYTMVYDRRCREIRSKVFAHNIITEADKVSKLFANTSYRDLARILVFVDSLCKVLFALLYNGRLLNLRLGRPNRVPDAIVNGDETTAMYLGFQMIAACKGFMYENLLKKPAPRGP
jgi:hypothetical protein